MSRTFPTGQSLTGEMLFRRALDEPLSPWATFKGSVADQFLQNPGLGSLIREGSTPELAREVVGGGRGGVHWRDETPEEVAARGDVLFETEDAYRASPSYRAAIPFEKGMTESRARALSDMYDVSQVRNHYASKRPVIGMAGSLTGAALDPVNFIPIGGEAAAAWSVARVGKVAGRALAGGVDAGANAALFSAMTAQQRAKFGDDVSWQALMANAAYAAMAGAVIGGAVGAGSKFLGSDAPKVIETDAAPMGLSTSGTATGRLEPNSSVFADAVIGNMETAGNRVNAVDILNDAVFTLANDGEVRLAGRSRAIYQDFGRMMSDAEVNRVAIELQSEIGGSFRTLTDAMGNTIEPRDLSPLARRIVDAMPENLRNALHDAAGRERGLREAEDLLDEDALDEFRAISARDAVDPEIVRAASSYIAKEARKAASDGMRTGDSQRFAKTSANFHVPAPEQFSVNIKAADAKITARMKPLPQSTPVKQMGVPKEAGRAADDIDPLQAKDGAWRDEIISVTVEGKTAAVKAGAAVDAINTRMKSLEALMECVRAS